MRGQGQEEVGACDSQAWTLLQPHTRKGRAMEFPIETCDDTGDMRYGFFHARCVEALPKARVHMESGASRTTLNEVHGQICPCARRPRDVHSCLAAAQCCLDCNVRIAPGESAYFGGVSYSDPSQVTVLPPTREEIARRIHVELPGETLSPPSNGEVRGVHSHRKQRKSEHTIRHPPEFRGAIAQSHR